MKKSLLKILFFSIISGHVFIAESLKALIPYYIFQKQKAYKNKVYQLGKKLISFYILDKSKIV